MGSGALEKYSGVNALKPFIDVNLVLERMVPFRLPEVKPLPMGGEFVDRGSPVLLEPFPHPEIAPLAPVADGGAGRLVSAPATTCRETPNALAISARLRCGNRAATTRTRSAIVCATDRATARIVASSVRRTPASRPRVPTRGFRAR